MVGQLQLELNFWWYRRNIRMLAQALASEVEVPHDLRPQVSFSRHVTLSRNVFLVQGVRLLVAQHGFRFQ